MNVNSRQRVLQFAATSLGVGFQGQSEESAEASKLPMLPASFRGLYYRRLGDWKNAAYWYGVAARSEPFPELQQQIVVPPRMELTPTGDFLLRASTEGWRIRSDTAPGAEFTKSDSETIIFSCSEIAEEKKTASLSWTSTFDIPYHHTLILRAKPEAGTILIFASVMDGKSVRHLTHKGDGEWQEFVFPAEGNHVSHLYITVREDLNSPVITCQAEIDTISFLLDDFPES